MNAAANAQRADRVCSPRRRPAAAPQSGCPVCGPNCLDFASLVESVVLRERVRELKRALAVALGAEDLAACDAARDEWSALLAGSAGGAGPEAGPATVLDSALSQRGLARRVSRPVKGRKRCQKTGPARLDPAPGFGTAPARR